jgi:hypothetical protein
MPLKSGRVSLYETLIRSQANGNGHCNESGNGNGNGHSNGHAAHPPRPPEGKADGQAVQSDNPREVERKGGAHAFQK